MSTRFVLTAPQRDAVARGRFVRVDRDGRSILVGRVEGSWRAYANVCRHRALPLDLGAASPMSDDGRFLLCSQHGALYRLSDGECILGPCVGDKLAIEPIVEDSGALVLEASSATARYPYLAIDVGEDEAEAAAQSLFDSGAAGVEWRDATTLSRGTAGKVTLIASFDHEQDARSAAREVPSAWSPRLEELIGDAWRDEWKKHFEPFRIAGPIVVAPPWRPYRAISSERVIVLEPGRAFGTGLHETTRVVAQVVVDQADGFRGQPVLDVGCGSGILSLVALAMGARCARAIDLDPEAVLVTRENAARNGIAEKVCADDAPLQDVAGVYAAVLANIEAQTLVELAPALMRRVAAGGLLVLGGILAPDVAPGQLDGVRRAYAELREASLHRDGDWVALVLGR